MTKAEATNMLKAKLECLKRETSGTDFDCNNSNCDDCSLCYEQGHMWEQKEALQMAIKALEQQPCEDTISRQAAIEAIGEKSDEIYKTKQKGATYPHDDFFQGMAYAENVVKQLPPIQPEKEIAKRVLWTGWKGYRDTRYKCPNCKKPVKNDDIYCHRCGQKLMFPHISFTDYVPGEKQETIVRWDDE